jgi:hypothetical protein
MTAGEWLIVEAMKLFTQAMKGTLNEDTFDDDVSKIIIKAKEMEKENLYNFYIQGGIDCATQADRTVEDFYNETFKSE